MGPLVLMNPPEYEGVKKSPEIKQDCVERLHLAWKENSSFRVISLRFKSHSEQPNSTVPTACAI